MEVGIGHHGEPGIDVRETVSAAEMADLMLKTVLPDLPFVAGQRVAVLVSGLGATPIMELYILYGELAKRLEAQGITIAFNAVGNLFTSLEMMGVTLTFMRLDDELESCLKAPCHCVGLTVPGDAGAARTYAGKLAATSAAPAVAVQKKVAAPREFAGQTVALGNAGDVVRELIKTINANRDFLSEIDGLIGDGDHGVNMSKGFTGCGTRLDAMGEQAKALPAAFEQLSKALMEDIGGSMGPLYGQFFLGFVNTLEPYEKMDAALFADALAAAVANVQGMGNAQVGDKTLIDSMVPARDAFRAALESGADFAACLAAMSEAAEKGKDSTKNLQARIGRSARLGPRSIGVLDAGATSCCLILQSIGKSLTRQLSAS